MNTHIANRLADLSLLWRTVVACCLVSVFAGPAAAQTPVTTCGQTLTTRGQLVGDLDCTAYDGTAAILLLGTSIDFAGHVLTVGPAVVDAIRCSPPCEIHSTAPGAAILGPSETGIAIRDEVGKRNVVSDLHISGPETGVFSEFRTFVDAARLTIESCSLDGMRNFRLRIIDSEISGNGRDGIHAGFLDMRASSVHGNVDAGVRGVNLKIRDSTIFENAVASVDGAKVRLFDSQVGPGGSGIYCRLCSLVRSEISGTNSHGLQGALSLKMRDSAIRMNLGHGIVSDFGSDPYSKESKLRILGSRIEDNGGDGVRDERGGVLTVRQTTVEGNLGHGFEVARAKATLSQATIVGNGRSGIERLGNSDCSSLSLTRFADSTIQGNGLDPDCGVGSVCADVATCDPLTLSSTVCDTSYDTLSGVPGLSWGVCSLD